MEFRDHLLRERPDIEDLLRELASDAEVYASLSRLPADSAPGRFYYRVVTAMDSAAVTPILLWLLRWPESRLGAAPAGPDPGRAGELAGPPGTVPADRQGPQPGGARAIADGGFKATRVNVTAERAVLVRR